MKKDFYPTWQEASIVCIENKIANLFHYRKVCKKIDDRLHNKPYRFYSDFPGWYIFLGKDQNPFIKTWQEASSICVKNNVKSYEEYRKIYKNLDPKLPSQPHRHYKDFPGWVIFLGKSYDFFYKTWQEASVVCVKNEIKNSVDYDKKRYKLDPKLPKWPNKFYSDFPGWNVFLKKNFVVFYQTWQEASLVCINNNIISQKDYHLRRKEIDPRLPSDPGNYYPDFPKWRVFLFLYYKTWQEASIVCVEHKIRNSVEYRNKYKLVDERLPSSPDIFYKDFPGWVVFLRKFYFTWREASEICVKNGVKSRKDYLLRRKEIDLRLPNMPTFFYKNFPGWNIFLNNMFYVKWQEASIVCVKNRISSRQDYYARWKNGIDKKLPSNPESYYKDFPGWGIFLNKKKRDFYPTWQEASIASVNLKIRSSTEYRRRYKADPKLAGCPCKLYSDFPGWRIFLSRNFYITWQEASDVCKFHHIKSIKNYHKRYALLDPRLHSNPQKFYSDFPGWYIFLGKNKTKKFLQSRK